MNINPSLKDFLKLSKKHNLIVFSYKFFSDWLTPLSIYYGLMKDIKAESFLLESVEGQEKVCRFSFLGFMPLCTFKSKDKKIYVKDGVRERVFETGKDPLYELKKIMGRFRAAPLENLRLFGGFVGYLGYDAVRFYEPVGKSKADPLDTFDSYFVLPKFLIIFDHRTWQVEILMFVDLKNTKDLKNVYQRQSAILQDIYKKIVMPHRLPLLDFRSSELKMKSNFKKGDFIAAVKKTKKYIKEGEIIQAVLSQRFSVDFKADPFTAYRYLRILNPSPYMFFLQFKDVKIAGSSPEMLLRCEKEQLITRPIAGTRKRGSCEAEDKKLQESLLADPKEKAEHIMLLDLARNDLGRIAGKGSVEIPIFMTIERFSHVMHIVSEVRAKLRKGEDIFSSLVSCFPAGTVSGAPKVRAMQIINELEPCKRGIYAGCVGYFSFTKSLDTCIIIRTIVFKNNKAYIQAGAGIVSGSVPEREYKETVNKAKAQILALKLAYKP
ncbi:MAG: anthranilate synthase component I [Candidatus Omnitrophota bacterium]|nr:MAG: anthranilate synthase component I [Candidatus Omnitrophota bacterium]